MTRPDHALRPEDRVPADAGPGERAAARRFKDVLGTFATGLTVVTSTSDGRPVGFTCQAFASISLDPPLVLVAPSRGSRTWPAVAAAGRFAVNVLAADQAPLADVMATSGGDKFAGVSWRTSPLGSPLLDGAVSWLDCTVETVHDAGDHLLVLGRVHDLDADLDRAPLLYVRGAYRTD